MHSQFPESSLQTCSNKFAPPVQSSIVLQKVGVSWSTEGKLLGRSSTINMQKCVTFCEWGKESCMMNCEISFEFKVQLISSWNYIIRHDTSTKFSKFVSITIITIINFNGVIITCFLFLELGKLNFQIYTVPQSFTVLKNEKCCLT